MCALGLITYLALVCSLNKMKIEKKKKKPLFYRPAVKIIWDMKQVAKYSVGVYEMFF